MNTHTIHNLPACQLAKKHDSAAIKDKFIPPRSPCLRIISGRPAHWVTYSVQWKEQFYSFEILPMVLNVGMLKQINRLKQDSAGTKELTIDL